MAETVVELIAEGKDITTHLTDTEKIRLKECEQVIRKGFDTFLEVGRALAEIKFNRLYRATHKAFEKYSKDVWDFTGRYADMQIDASETIDLLESKVEQLFYFSDETPSGKIPKINKEKCTDCKWRKGMANRKYKGVKIPGEHGKCIREGGLCEKKTESAPAQTEIILPINEAQTRPLTKLKNPDDQVKAWSIVLNMLNEDPKRKLTAALIHKAVKEVRGEVVKKKIKDTKKAVDATSLLSKQFKNQHQVMLDIIVAEKNSEWVTSKRKEVIKWMKALVSIAESDD